MKKLMFISSFLVLLCSVSSAQFSSLENALPAHTPQDQIISHTAYILKYNEQYEQAEWVVYFLTIERVKGNIDRTDNFRPDPNVKTGSASLADYKGSGYDRGHLAPAAQRSGQVQS